MYGYILVPTEFLGNQQKNCLSLVGRATRQLYNQTRTSPDFWYSKWSCGSHKLNNQNKSYRNHIHSSLIAVVRTFWHVAHKRISCSPNITLKLKHHPHLPLRNPSDSGNDAELDRCGLSPIYGHIGTSLLWTRKMRGWVVVEDGCQGRWFRLQLGVTTGKWPFKVRSSEPRGRTRGNCRKERGLLSSLHPETAQTIHLHRDHTGAQTHLFMVSVDVGVFVTSMSQVSVTCNRLRQKCSS